MRDGSSSTDARWSMLLRTSSFGRSGATSAGLQHYALWPHLTVHQNIAYPLQRHKIPKQERPAMVAAVAKMVGLADMLDRYPAQCPVASSSGSLSRGRSCTSPGAPAG